MLRTGLVSGKKPIKLVSQTNCYKKLKLIGHGTFGKVYLVMNTKNNKTYALKEVLQDKRYKNRELSIISQIKHNNVIQMLDYFLTVEGDDCYLSIVMEYVPMSLSSMLKERRVDKKPFTPVFRKMISFQIFKALYYFQLNKVCHRDLKPPNILINDETFQVKICDFGSAKFLENNERNVAYICSRYYRAPELILGNTSYSMEIDVWSAGCIIIELLTLEPIFPGDSSLEQLIEIMKVLGTPLKKYIELYEELNNTSLPLPLIKAANWKKVLKRYNPEPELIDLVGKMLIYQAEQRLKPIDALKHPYFKDLMEYKQTEKVPHLFSFEDLQSEENSEQIQQLKKIYGQPKLKLLQQINLKKKQFEAEVNTIESTPTAE